jgi:phosphoenolpyruvate carboxykinase (GTP)
MIPGQTIIGDDIAYIRPGEDGVPRAVNVEQGIFGIIENINQKNDPLIYKALTTPRELIVSNILIKDNNPYWLGMGMDLPEEGFNHSGEWKAGNKDSDGKDITPAHKNARYTIRINELDNADKNCDNPQGVPVNGFIYGGRDSDTSVPVSQSLSWAHGVFIGAAIESETTAAAIGQVGVRKHNPMSNVEFLTVPLSTYIQNHLRFGDELDKPPLIFATNYFLKENDQFLNEIVDKKVWMLWMEGRVHNEYEAIETPVGFLPKHEDLKQLFKEVFDRDYTEEEYNQQFSIKTTNLLEKLDRIEEIFKQEDDIPETFYQHLEQQRTRLKEAKEKQGKDIIQPADFS